jgi:chromosome partitioning protein
VPTLLPLLRKVFTTSGGAGDGGGGDFGRWLGRQLELELPDQKLKFRLRLGVAGQPQLPAIGRRQMDIDHLHGGECLQSTARGQSRRQSMQTALQGDLQAVRQERDEDMGFDPALVLMEPWADRLTRWWHRRPDSLPTIMHYDGIPLSEAGTAVAEIGASGDYNVLFVDTPPGIEQEASALKAIIRRSDLVLIPTTDGGEDLESVSEWMALVRCEERPAFFLLCLTDRELSSLGEAKLYLADKGRICPHDVRRSQAIKRSYFDGRGAADLTGKLGERAAVDYQAVWAFVRLELGLEG